MKEETEYRVMICAELITQILNDNRETINLIFKDIKEKLEKVKDTEEIKTTLREQKNLEYLESHGFTITSEGGIKKIVL
jgi:hypothetical protein